MKIRMLLVISLAIFFLGCAGSPVRTGWMASSNKKAMLNLRPNQSVNDVVEIMGNPEKTEMYQGNNGEPILVYLYITEGKDMHTRKWSEANYTPLVFVDEKLTGWGWNALDTAAERYELVIKDLY
jgi:hypothetical protein